MEFNYVTTSMNPTGNRYTSKCTTDTSSAIYNNSSAKLVKHPVVQVFKPPPHDENSGSAGASWIVGSFDSWHFLVTLKDGMVYRHRMERISSSNNTTTGGGGVNVNNETMMDTNTTTTTTAPIAASTTETTVEYLSTASSSWLPSSRPLVAIGEPLSPIILLPGSSKININASDHSTVVPTPYGGYLWIDSEQQLWHQRHVCIDATSSPTDDGESENYALQQGEQQQQQITLIDDVVEPLIDGHITYSSNNKMWALYSHSTRNRYVHGILGDSNEGWHLSILMYDDDDSDARTNATSAADEPPIILVNDLLATRSSLDENNEQVFEGLAPMWADLDLDGIDDVVTTIANSVGGAALRVYFLNSNGSVRTVAESPFIGRGDRWLHQLAVVPPRTRTTNGGDGDDDQISSFPEIVQVQTPHIGGIVKTFRYNPNDETNLVMESCCTSPFTSHTIFSRNIDQVVVADMNNDGIAELIIQSQSRNTLVGLQRRNRNDNDSDDGNDRDDDDGMDVVWSIPLNSPVQSNIAVSCTNDGNSALLFGIEGGEMVQVTFDYDGTDDGSSYAFDDRSHASSLAVPFSVTNTARTNNTWDACVQFSSSFLLVLWLLSKI